MANIIAAAAFLHFASRTWLEPALRGEAVARGGDALVWMAAAFPILAVSILANLIWIGGAALETRKTGAPWPVLTTVTVVVCWTCALTLDHLRGAGF